MKSDTNTGRDRAALSEVAAQLRQSFDGSFALPRQIEGSPMLDLLSIRVSGSAYAVRLHDIGGLYADRVVTPLPTPVPELLGIAGFRGTIVPVYSLPALLGAATTEGKRRWMVLAGAPNPVALAFDDFHGHIRVPADSVARETGARQGEYASEILRFASPRLIGESVCPVLSIPLILKLIGERAGFSARKEL